VIPLKDNIPTERFALVTVALILANVVAYLLSLSDLSFGSLIHGPSLETTFTYGATPYALTHPASHCYLLTAPDANGAAVRCAGAALPAGTTPDGARLTGAYSPSVVTALTSMFMHGGILHIAGNMLFLWIFGNNVEDSMGRLRFVAFYLLGGLAALAGQVLIDPGSTAPTIGASGAVAAVLGGYIVLYPRARVLTLVFIVIFVTVIELPAMLVLGLWFIEQLAFGYAGLANPTGGGGGVAYFAHIGGFVFGLVLIQAFVRQRKQVPPPHPVY
jgi:membrane associated rhomboid family serine protease